MKRWWWSEGLGGRGGPFWEVSKRAEAKGWGRDEERFRGMAQTKLAAGRPYSIMVTAAPLRGAMHARQERASKLRRRREHEKKLNGRKSKEHN
ncbi:uncharacterized protein CIMG_13759 [Coccidioides immitis RS]|uniref:Uncharacterized protein n=1 Tax=Coccidioides immitis (strain RS) TaxID=246410 RepID=A0A0D8JZA1_COCIM|nr:uncharacterized protein CIMG_13759 [Coccidioides immitis RS]KJF61593.1 hypothetical protein CIMG_13759 [Coccidioides immitis RS]